MHRITVRDFPHLDLGDVRRDERFVTIINNISRQPGASIPKQNGTWYDTKATYGFFKNEQVTLEELNKTLVRYGAKKAADENKLLLVHDISTLSYNDLQAKGLGYLANKEGRGILCYSSLAVTTEGLPLSLLYQHTWTRSLEQLGKASRRKQLPFEEKETYRWFEGMSEANKALGEDVHKIHIADREADVYELFFHAYQPGTDLLIRARHNRCLANGSYLWGHVGDRPVAAVVGLEIPDEGGKKKRRLEAEVRYSEVEVLRPATNKESCESVVLTAIEVKEKAAGDKKEEDCLQWRLLSTLEVKSAGDALQCVRWYTYRWLIERFHYVLKSGTGIEELQLKDAASLQKAIALYSLAAFRIMQMVYASRHHPQASCEVVLTKAQWRTLYLLIHKNNDLPQRPPTLDQAVRWIGRLGGHLGRNADGPPGLKTVWRGYQQLCHAANVYERMTRKI